MKKETLRKIETDEEIKIYSDPFRFKIVTMIMSENRPMTVKQIADKLEVSPAKVHYHVVKLLKINVLALVDTEVINGIIAKYYDTTAKAFSCSLSSRENSYDINNVSKAVSEVFETIKNKFLDELSRARNYEEEKGKNGMNIDVDIALSILHKKVYITKKELEEFLAYTEAFCVKHLERTSPDQIEYNIFRGSYNSFDPDQYE
ncbi:helix-turn-helix domain-containing protein [Clostridiaceae bacterium M8S5]|nr:helix-turn-helix domain-containing protein [Clostridiaceae bacterium M8S5]